MSKNTLAQSLAIKPGIKARSHEAHTEAYHVVQKPALFSGSVRTYRPKADDGERFPSEAHRVQFKAPDVIAGVEKELAAFYDVELTIDAANGAAVADLVVGEQTLATAVPATYLLFLIKHLTELKNFIGALPVLDAADEWKWDENASLFKTDAVETTKSKKMDKPIVLYAATDKHPAQTQLITEDVIIGYYELTKQSGALPLRVKKGYLERLEALLDAVQKARERAAQVEAPERRIGKVLFDFILRG